jgi:hypothetical protein
LPIPQATPSSIAHKMTSNLSGFASFD